LGAIGGQSAARDHTMKVRVMQQGLSPGMQHGKKTDFSSEVLRVGGNGAKSLGCCSEEDRVGNSFVLECYGSNLFGNRKYHVVVRNGKKFCQARFEPFGFGERLTLRAVAIATGVIRLSFRTALVAHVDVPAQKGSSADFDGAHGTMLLKRHGSAVDLPVVRAALAKDVGHFQGRPGHRCTGGSGRLGSDSKGLLAAHTVLLETCV